MTAAELVEVLGGHPARALGIDLDADAGLWSWLAACVLGAPEPGALAGFRALGAGELASETLAAADPTALATRLDAAGVRRPERPAATLVRAAGRLAERHEGSLHALLREAGELDAAGTALVRLAPGLGPATALHFLRALRGRLQAADDAPLAPAALAAAVCLGWLAAEDEPEHAASLLARRLESDPESPDPADLEAALERLGARSCRAARPARCPLAAGCPLRYRQEP